MVAGSPLVPDEHLFGVLTTTTSSFSIAIGVLHWCARPFFSAKPIFSVPLAQVGCRKALSIAAKYQLPVVAVHHMEAHAMVTRLPDPATGAPSAVQFPALILLVSGGHNMLVLTRALGDHTILGNTFDDSVGEAFDKTARLLGIDAIPGGPQLERMAAVGDPTMYANDLTVPLSKKHKEASYTCDFSYAGLKTNVRLLVEAEEQRVRAQYPEEEWEVSQMPSHMDPCPKTRDPPTE